MYIHIYYNYKADIFAEIIYDKYINLCYTITF